MRMKIKFFHEREIRLFFLFCTLCLFILLTIEFLVESFAFSYQNHLETIYGDWQNAFIETDLATVNRIKERPFLIQAGVQELYGSLILQEDTTVRIGYADDDFIEMANLTLISGRMPEAQNEIAVEKSLLDYLGFDYTLNQEMTLKIEAGGKTYEKEAVLVGILDNYSVNWIANEALITVFTSKGAAFAESYNLFLKWEAGAENSIEAIAYADCRTVDNEYLNISKRNVVSASVIELGVVLCAFLLSFLQINSAMKRHRYQYTLYLALGADPFQMGKKIAALLLFTSIKALPAAFLMSLFSSHLLLRLLQPFTVYPLRLYFKFSAVFKIGLMFSGALLLAVLLCFHTLQKLSITVLLKPDISAKRFHFWGSEKLSLKRIFLRNLSCYRAFFAAFVSVVLIFSCLCGWMIHQLFYQTRAFNTVLNSSYGDYTLRLSDPNAYGFSDQMLQRLAAVHGMESILLFRKEPALINFEGIENSSYFQLFKNDQNQLPITILAVEDQDMTTWQELLTLAGDIDQKAFREGRLAVLIAPYYRCENNRPCQILIDRKSAFENEITEDQLQPLQEVGILDQRNQPHQITIAQVVHQIPLSLYNKYDNFMLIVGAEFLEDFHPNYAYLFGNDFSDATDQIIAQITSSSLLMLDSTRKNRQIVFDQYIQNVLLYGTVLWLSALTEILLLTLLFQYFFNAVKRQRRIFMMLSMEAKDARKLYCRYFQLLTALLLFTNMLIIGYERLCLASVLLRDGEAMSAVLAYRQMFILDFLLGLILFLSIEWEYRKIEVGQ